MNFIIPIIISGLFIATAYSKKSQKSDFFLANRSASTGTVAMSLVATAVGASATFVTMQLAFINHWHGFWFLGAGVPALFLLAFFWVKPMKSSPQVRSLPQWLGTCYGQPARKLSALLITLMWLAIISAQFIAAGKILNQTFGWNYQLSVVFIAFVITYYTIKGGQSSILRTDFIQAFILICGILIPLYAFKSLNMNLVEALPKTQNIFEKVSAFEWFAKIITIGGMYIVGPDFYSRILVARDNKSAKNGAIIAAIILALCAATLTLVATAISRNNLGPNNPANTLTWLINDSTAFSPLLQMIINCGLLCALISSADTCLLTVATVCTLDLLPQKPQNEIKMARIFLFVSTIIVIFIACFAPQIYPKMMIAYSFFSGGLLMPLLLLKWPKVATKIPQKCVWCAIIIGGFLPQIIKLTSWNVSNEQQTFFAIIISGIILLLGFLRATANNSSKNSTK